MDVKTSYMILGGTAVLSMGIGGVAGFFIARKKLEAKYDAILIKEIAEAKKFYSVLHKQGKYDTPQSAVEARIPSAPAEIEEAVEEAIVGQAEAVEALINYQGKKQHKPRVAKESVTIDSDDTGTVETIHNIFTDEKTPSGGFVSEDGFDYDEEIKNRSSDAPYVISKEEFFENEPDHEQVTFTYYVGDDVLADEQDGAVNESDVVVGDDNIARMGEGSGDPHVVYIRNEKIDMDIEIVMDMGKFTEKILGFIQHSDNRKQRKFRQGDDE